MPQVGEQVRTSTKGRELWSRRLGIVATVACVILAIYSIGEAVTFAVDAFRLGVALYVAAFTWRYWAANPQHGMTWQDIFDAFWWPIRRVLNSKPLKGKLSFTFKFDNPADGTRIRYDSSRTALKNPYADIVGILLVALAAWLMWKAIWIGLDLVWAAMVLVFTVWATGAIYQFWSTSAWKGGLTLEGFVRVFCWPVFVYRKRQGKRQD